MTWWLAVETATGKPLRRITHLEVVADDEGKPLGTRPVRLDGESAIEVPGAFSLDDFAQSTFNFTKKEFEFEQHHYVSVDPQTGVVVGDVLSTAPVHGDAFHAVIDVTDVTKDLRSKMGTLSSKVYDFKSKTFKEAKRA